MVLTLCALAWPLTMLLVVALCAAARRGESVSVEGAARAQQAAAAEPAPAPVDAPLEFVHAA